MSIFTKISILSLLAVTFSLPSISFAQLSDTADGSPSCVELTRTLSYGMKDATTDGEVSELQAFLKEKGYLTGNTTGTFGTNTRTAVKTLQAVILPEVDVTAISDTIVPLESDRQILANSGFKLSSTGSVGKYTRAKIAYMSCNEDEDDTVNEDEDTEIPVITNIILNKTLKRITVEGTNLDDVISLKYVAEPLTGTTSITSTLASTLSKTGTRIIFLYGDTTKDNIPRSSSTWKVTLGTAGDKVSADFMWQRTAGVSLATKKTLLVEKVGQGTVTSYPTGIDCGSTCSLEVTTGNSVRLTATPASGYTFQGWRGACTNTTGTCTVVMNEAKNVSAAFIEVNAQSAGQWTFQASCPTACGASASTQTAVCTGGNGSCDGVATTRTCEATAVCAVAVTCPSPLILNTTGTACVSQPSSSSASIQKPIGYLDTVTSGAVGSCGLIEGWALDKDNLASPTEINIYVDGDAGQGSGYNVGLTTVLRPDVNSAYTATGNHGYRYQIPNLTPGTHTVDVYSHGINTEGGMVSTEPRKLQGGSRYTFLCNSSNDTSSATNPGNLVITTNYLHPIVSGHGWTYDLAVTGTTEPVTWSLASGVLPFPMELDSVKGIISNSKLYNHHPTEINNKLAVGIHTFTVKATSGQYSVSKQLSFEVLPQGTQKPIIHDQIQPNMAVDQYAYPGSIPDNSWLLYTVAPPDTCTLVSGQLPPGITLRRSDYGTPACVLSGIARQTGTFKVVWKAQNQFGSDERALAVSVYRPSETYEVSVGSSLPDGEVGKPYYYKINFQTTGNPDISSARFGSRNSTLYNFGLKLDEFTGEITGTPTNAGSGVVTFSFGVSTLLHMSGMTSTNIVIKPRNQTQAETNLDINTAIRRFTWTTNKAADAIAFKILMVQNGWTIRDVTNAMISAGFSWNMGEVAKILYPDSTERGWVLVVEINKAIATFDWSEANKNQSALSFREIMVKNGWSLLDVLFSKFTLSGYGVAENEIKKVIEANPISVSFNPLSSLSKVLGDYTSNLSCIDIPRNLIRGTESLSVTKLQDFLIKKGFLNDVSTGFYGDNTIEAVKDYQASKGLPTTGMVYDFTRKAIEEETCR